MSDYQMKMPGNVYINTELVADDQAKIDRLQKLAAQRKAHNEDPNARRAVPRIHQETSTNNPVNSPSHYTSGGIETIDFIEAKKLNYNLGNAVKYITRAGKKFPEELVDLNIKNLNAIVTQDLEKAVWYLQREIQTLKGK